MYMLICEECGKEFTAQYKSKIRKFCSHRCANKHRWANIEKKEIVLECDNCKKEFTVKAYDYRLKNGNIKFCSKKCMGESKRTGKFINCKQCGKIFYTTRNELCSKECAAAYRSKNSEHKTYIENGYIVQYEKGYNKKGNVKQHRKVMEDYLGRKLTSEEVVHHINENKMDNRIENLEVMLRGKHSSYHRKKEKEEGKHLFGGYHNN